MRAPSLDEQEPWCRLPPSKEASIRPILFTYSFVRKVVIQCFFQGLDVNLHRYLFSLQDVIHLKDRDVGLLGRLAYGYLASAVAIDGHFSAILSQSDAQ